MEIDEAIRNCDDCRLKTKYKSAVYVIQRALALYEYIPCPFCRVMFQFRFLIVKIIKCCNIFLKAMSQANHQKGSMLRFTGDIIEEVALSFNGGKDSTVLLHLLRAGYYLHKKEKIDCDEDLKQSQCKFPIRTIYFESTSIFPEINSFTYETAASPAAYSPDNMWSSYNLQLDIIRQDFKSGLEGLLRTSRIRAIFLGVRIGDPTAVGQEQFSPSSPGWPSFMRVNPILDWSYRDVWAFLLKSKVLYCSLYDQGYTSIGSVYDTVPNALLCVSNPSSSKEEYRPAYMLSDGRLERAGRLRRSPHEVERDIALSNGLSKTQSLKMPIPTAAVVGVGDEILFGKTEDVMGPSLCKKLHSIGWMVTQFDVIRNDVDAVAEGVERQKSTNDMVFVYGGVGPLPTDTTLGGIAKAFGVRLAPDEEFEEYLARLVDYECTGDRNEMAELPEGITQLLHHENLPVPLVKCQNVIIFMATNLSELDKEWDSLVALASSSGLLMLPRSFASKYLTTTLSDVEAAQPLSALHIGFPDLYIGCYRKSRWGPLVITLEGKDPVRIELATEALTNKFQPGVFSEIN
ncbi:hypothetical protein Cgig2_011905 [Carnegiea gigantea]|uniref:FAD synthase n=1 Tax=Carnegiea gigantea TaxID=171969 RepID=A0A9Q1GXE6_9CARY|nr:hypothetical protein Cgig2_011905 [Carnegiea gigantea]